MFFVVDINFSKDGVTEKILFRSAKVRECWDMIKMHLNSPSKQIKAKATRLYIFDKSGNMVWRMPYDVKEALIRHETQIFSQKTST